MAKKNKQEEIIEETDKKVKKLPKIPQIGGKRLSTLIEIKEIREAI